MPRSISANLKDHYAAEVRTIARCWQIERQDATILGFTDHDEDLEIEGITYESLNSGQTSAIEANDNLSVNTMDIQIVLDSEGITRDDVKAGRYERAMLWIFEVNYKSLADGYVTLGYGYIGELTLHDNYISAEFRSLSQLLQNNIGRVYLPTCDAQFCDSRCTLTQATYTVSKTVSAVTDRSEFTVESAGSAIYTNGRVTWTSGLNNGLTMEIKEWGANVKLILPMPFNIAIDDTVDITQGCAKTKEACKAYSNYVNFQGFPDLPGIDEMLDYPTIH
jgi:uncharacterized phage protein (TIGR02218 family)